LRQGRALLRVTGSKEIEIVACRLTGNLITAETRTTLYYLFMKCLYEMFVQRRESERPFVIAGNKIMKCIFKKVDTLIGAFDL